MWWKLGGPQQSSHASAGAAVRPEAAGHVRQASPSISGREQVGNESSIMGSFCLVRNKGRKMNRQADHVVIQCKVFSVRLFQLFIATCKVTWIYSDLKQLHTFFYVTVSVGHDPGKVFIGVFLSSSSLKISLYSLPKRVVWASLQHGSSLKEVRFHHRC